MTYFEAMTLMAFLWFAQQRVDYAVVEVGLGGRLDATNALEPRVSVIANRYRYDMRHRNASAPTLPRREALCSADRDHLLDVSDGIGARPRRRAFLRRRAPTGIAGRVCGADRERRVPERGAGVAQAHHPDDRCRIAKRQVACSR